MGTQYEDLMRKIVSVITRVQYEMGGAVPLGISNRHIHLSQQDLEKLFGPGYELTKTKDLVQPGQFACKETLTICGPKALLKRCAYSARSENRRRLRSLRAIPSSLV